MTIEEKIRIIEETESFADVPSEVLPTSYKESYYFISYSHKDYKMVLSDILRLEALGVNVWYDKEMHIGENWREIAQLYISKFQCAGVIFYLTENSISSPACNQEVEYVLTHDKNFLSINKALSGRPVESGEAMLRAMKERGLPVSDALLASFHKAFGNEIVNNEGSTPYINRKILGQIVFNDKEKLKLLNSITHPLIHQEIEKLILDCNKQLIIIEAAILLETSLRALCNTLWYVYADENIRLERLQKYRNIDKEKALQIMKNQWSDKDFRSDCQVIIDNSFDKENTYDQIKINLPGGSLWEN